MGEVKVLSANERGDMTEKDKALVDTLRVTIRYNAHAVLRQGMTMNALVSALVSELVEIDAEFRSRVGCTSALPDMLRQTADLIESGAIDARWESEGTA